MVPTHWILETVFDFTIKTRFLPPQSEVYSQNPHAFKVSEPHKSRTEECRRPGIVVFGRKRTFQNLNNHRIRQNLNDKMIVL